MSNSSLKSNSIKPFKLSSSFFLEVIGGGLGRSIVDFGSSVSLVKSNLISLLFTYLLLSSLDIIYNYLIFNYHKHKTMINNNKLKS